MDVGLPRREPDLPDPVSSPYAVWVWERVGGGVRPGPQTFEPGGTGGQPGSVPFVSDRPGAYGRLLLAVYVRWQTGLLVSSDWLRPVTRGGWRTGFPEPVRGLVSVS